MRAWTKPISGLLLALAAGQSVAGPTSENAFPTAAMLSGDCRLVVLGDSFATSTFRRPPVAMLNFWEASPLTAIAVPAGGLSHLGAGEPLASPYKVLNAEGDNDYHALGFTGEPVPVTLPVRSVYEFVGAPGFTPGDDGALMAYSVTNARIKLTPGERLTSVGDRVLFRALYWSPPNPALMHSPVELRVGADTLASVNPRIHARPRWHEGADPTAALATDASPGEINALGQDLDLVLQPGNANAQVVLAAGRDTLLDGRALHPAGGVYARLDPGTGQRLPGLYYSALSDQSWSYSGFSSDTEPASALDKTYTIDQFTGWLDATTLDPDQPVVFAYYLAAEPNNDGDAPQRIEAMIDQAQAAADAVGIARVRHLLIVPHMHEVKGLPTEFVMRFRFDQQRNAMFEIAARRPEVSAVSIYDATDRVLFNGSDEARQWLRDNAPNPFRYTYNSVDLADGPLAGDLLDNFVLHPEGEHGAAYFASVLYRELFKPLDLDTNRDGLLDLGDIQLFVGLFLLEDIGADINRDGVLDLGDIQDFVERFLDETS